jgi:hypothetical protein
MAAPRTRSQCCNRVRRCAPYGCLCWIASQVKEYVTNIFSADYSPPITLPPYPANKIQDGCQPSPRSRLSLPWRLIGASCERATTTQGNAQRMANKRVFMEGAYVDGDFNYGDASGAGLLVVTGTLWFR